MIYCGYQGVGKTSYCKTHPNCIDLDSSNYEKVDGWVETYVNDAINFEKEGNTVFISAHKSVIRYLNKNQIKFILIIPDEPRGVWNLRLKLRYKITKELYALKAFEDFKKHFEKDMKFYKKLKCKKILVKAVRILTDLDTKL